MFNGFFIIIGEIVLSIASFFRDLSIKDIEIDKSKSDELNLEIFSKLELSAQPVKKSETKADEMRDGLLKYMLKKPVIVLLFSILVLLALLASLEISGIYLVCIVMFYLFILYYPQMKEQRSYGDLNQELPYALRHMGIELKAGRGLHDALITIRDGDYGSLSREFARVLEEIKFGKSTEDSLLEMSHRVKSDGLSRAIHQIIGTLRVGGNLAGSLEIIAGDISFDMQIKLKEYSQKLNSFILIYTFIAILAPVICLIMLMAGSTVMGDVISSELLLVIYTIFFPMIVMFMGLFIKKLEPKI
ncbi:type II secretion system F family protein [Methanobrevibacter sp.]|uniref:type II secretion system F family protein n=1 Tax=Methanobrevibacter sp. TaxID=66852 RepID=UPI0025F2AECE|nr:type II secretion system F family protein [Methanobrevibacter sp.]MBQ2665901.1 type II secretion system F family protein [Methanobrevibacter sp.]